MTTPGCGRGRGGKYFANAWLHFISRRNRFAIARGEPRLEHGAALLTLDVRFQNVGGLRVGTKTEAPRRCT
jgi:hypothetical protein